IDGKGAGNRELECAPALRGDTGTAPPQAAATAKVGWLLGRAVGAAARRHRGSAAGAAIARTAANIIAGKTRSGPGALSKALTVEAQGAASLDAGIAQNSEVEIGWTCGAHQRSSGIDNEVAQIEIRTRGGSDGAVLHGEV